MDQQKRVDGSWIWQAIRQMTQVFVLCHFLTACTSSIVPSSEHFNSAESLKKPYVVLVSIDGYRSDYTDLYSPPTLKKLKETGASAKGLLPVYPSKTFTNHYSIATGMYAENHGIVSNQFFDPSRGEEYRLSNKQAVQDGSWYRGTPLWVTAEKQGMLAANYFWPGSESAIQGIRPSYYYTYNETVSLETRVQQVKNWLELSPAKRPHLITLYFADVDTAGHHFGPASVEVQRAVAKVDQAIEQLLKFTTNSKLPVNVIIVSDHGMQELNTTDIEYLDDYIDFTGIRILGDGLHLSLYFTDSKKIEQTYEELKSKAKHYKVYKRSEMPVRLHYSKDSRCGDLIVVPQAPYVVGLRNAKFKVSKGGHGYDPDTTPTMQGIFYATGPQIKKGIQVEPFRNIHIYPFVLKLLELKLETAIDGEESVLVPIYHHMSQQWRNVNTTTGL
jgi:predicted AlkP superfamily pyrophosphatase or phosphodiesterase